MRRSGFAHERVPLPYSVVAAVLYCVIIAGAGLWWHGGWRGRLVVMGIAAVYAGVWAWALRYSFRKNLTEPLPRRGINGLIVRLPNWLMVPAYLAYLLAISLGTVLVATRVLPLDRPFPWWWFIGFVVLLTGNQAAAWWVIRRRA